MHNEEWHLSSSETIQVSTYVPILKTFPRTSVIIFWLNNYGNFIVATARVTHVFIDTSLISGEKCELRQNQILLLKLHVSAHLIHVFLRLDVTKLYVLC